MLLHLVPACRMSVCLQPEHIAENEIFASLARGCQLMANNPRAIVATLLGVHNVSPSLDTQYCRFAQQNFHEIIAAG